jgi:hypothetical protein
MGRWVNGLRTNVLAVVIVVLVSLCGAAYGVDSFLIQIHVLS